jgi:hypothetical protein
MLHSAKTAPWIKVGLHQEHLRNKKVEMWRAEYEKPMRT